jgi:hypothetical protein
LTFNDYDDDDDYINNNNNNNIKRSCIFFNDFLPYTISGSGVSLPQFVGTIECKKVKGKAIL